MQKEIRIGERLVGTGRPAYIIAEMSANHAGSMERAKEIIRAAKECGADCVKIQTYTPDTITIDCHNEYFHIEKGTWEGENLYSLYGKAYTPWEWQAELKEEAKKVGIDFLSTPFDFTAVDFLEEIGMEFYKIASFEMVDIPLIKYVASKGKPIIMSTGMATLEEIEEAVEAVRSTGNEQLVLMKCSSAYPANPADMHLKTICDLRERFQIPIGLSDHSMGSMSAATAVALGACVIEKHFCLGREIENPDASFSMTPQEFKEMVEDVRRVEAAIGVPTYGVCKQEESNKGFRRSLFVVKDIEEGEIFTEENIRSIRPGYGLHTRELNNVLGKKCRKSLKRGTPLAAADVAGYLRLEPAKEAHCELIYNWANDPETRKQSFTTAQIPWEEHKTWYYNSLQNPARKIYICYHEDTPIGVFRIDLSGDAGRKAEISYSIAPGYRRRGYGIEMLRAGELQLAEDFEGLQTLCAKVKRQNEASCRIFRGLNYAESAEGDSVLFKKQIVIGK